jgi:low affinity Fe/Cu permease
VVRPGGGGHRVVCQPRRVLRDLARRGRALAAAHRVFHSVDTWQLVINTATSVIAFLLIALLTNTERRGDQALHRKFDILAVSIAELLESEDRERLRACASELRAAVKLEEQI